MFSARRRKPLLAGDGISLRVKWLEPTAEVACSLLFLYDGKHVQERRDELTPFAGVDTTRLLVESMKVARENHRVLANNIANAETPHYNPVELDFQATLRAALGGRGRVSLRRTQPRHFDVQFHRPKFERLAILSKNDYNKVDLDDQMAKLAQNTGRYTTYGSLLVKQFEQIKNMLTQLR